MLSIIYTLLLTDFYSVIFLPINKTETTLVCKKSILGLENVTKKKRIILNMQLKEIKILTYE